MYPDMKGANEPLSILVNHGLIRFDTRFSKKKFYWLTGYKIS